MAASSSLNNAQILVIDDEPDLRTLYELALQREGYQVSSAGTLAQAHQTLDKQIFDIIITDMRLPDGSGLDVLQHIRKCQRKERCVVITAYGSAENAVESLKAGAFDYLTKPVDLKQFRTVISSAIQGSPLVMALPGEFDDADIKTTPTQAASPAATEALNRLVGESASIKLVKDRIVKVARSMAPVLITGESGTGKELVARALHANSHRAGKAFVAVNCSAIPDDLLEVEFFGALKGAYTGASRDRNGLFHAAQGGTLFLDEIGDLPQAMQAKLLRAIQERSIRPVGSTVEEAVDVRIISASHKTLPSEIAAGRFRQDLFYRLNVIEIVLPPLRDRMEDLPVLCNSLLKRIAAESNLVPPPVSDRMLDHLATCQFPGNIRELENILYRAIALHEGGELEFQNSKEAGGELLSAMSANPATERSVSPDPALPDDLQGHLDKQERDILLQALHQTGYNRTAAAAMLGLNLRQIRYRIARLNIDVRANVEESDGKQ